MTVERLNLAQVAAENSASGLPDWRVQRIGTLAKGALMCAAAVCDAGANLAAACSDGTLYIWDIAQGILRPRLALQVLLVAWSRLKTCGQIAGSTGCGR